MWIVAYDTTWENDSGRTPSSSGAQATGAPGLMSRAPTPSRWANISWAQTLVDLGPTKRCQLFTFAGPAAHDAESSIDDVGPSIRFQG